ncbi:MAG: hypothetical protein Kow0031_14380 [Anaerolineae bacterium]
MQKKLLDFVNRPAEAGESGQFPPLVTIRYPGESPWLAVPHGRWRREGDKIVVAYPDHDELFWSVACSAILKEVMSGSG